ncbi:four-helix bundle copper-binding protein [Paraburkholderia kururiensis]
MGTAGLCDACAAQCEKHEHEHCRQCAQACRNCAEACRAMA